jgi:uncharacterized protein
MKVEIEVGAKTLEAELFDTELGRMVADILPIEGDASPWGDELYFAMDIVWDPVNPQEVMEIGDLAYWPPGNAFCIFYGPTPASQGSEPRIASPGEVFGRITGDAAVLKGSRGGKVTVRAR